MTASIPSPTRVVACCAVVLGLATAGLVVTTDVGSAAAQPVPTPTRIVLSPSPLPPHGELARPTILPLVVHVEALDGSETTTSVGDQTTLALSSDVFFQFGSAQLTGEAGARIEALSRDVAGAQGPVQVVGYTDDVGSDSVNIPLSRQRAEAVAAELRRLAPGVELTVDGRGSADPVAANTVDGQDNPEGRARNRRVEVIYRG